MRSGVRLPTPRRRDFASECSSGLDGGLPKGAWSIRGSRWKRKLHCLVSATQLLQRTLQTTPRFMVRHSESVRSAPRYIGTFAWLAASGELNHGREAWSITTLILKIIIFWERTRPIAHSHYPRIGSPGSWQSQDPVPLSALCEFLHSFPYEHFERQRYEVGT